MSRVYKKTEIENLRKQRDELWKFFNSLSQKNSVTGLNIAEGLEVVQNRLNQLGDKSERYYCNIKPNLT